MSKGYLWFSFSSDETGTALAKALGFESGKKTPAADKYPVILAWGAKSGTAYKQESFLKQVEAGKLRLINTVEAIEANRNKLGVFKHLKEKGIPVPGFIEVPALVGTGEEAKSARLQTIVKAVKNGSLAFPIIGCGEELRNPIFCQTEEDIAYALKRADNQHIQYFRSHCPGTEFRVHVFRDQVFIAQKKELAKDPIKAYTEDLIRSLRKQREKNTKLQTVLTDHVLSPEVIGLVVSELAEDLLDNSSHMQRSVSRGWELKDVPLSSVSGNAKDQAVAALDAMGLDLGAVTLSVDGKDVRITSITTGPHLPPAHMELYVKVISEFSAQKSVADSPKKPALTAKVAVKNPEIRARLAQKLDAISDTRAATLLALLEGE